MIQLVGRRGLLPVHCASVIASFPSARKRPESRQSAACIGGQHRGCLHKHDAVEVPVAGVFFRPSLIAEVA